MEPEKERIPTPPSTVTSSPTAPAKSYQSQPTKSYIPIQKSYAQEVCVVLGIVFLVIGLVGFVVDNLLEAHLSYTHNAIHVVTGALALWFGFDSTTSAKRFNYIFGTIYGLLGILGFVLGKKGMPTVGSISEDSHLWKVIPNVLELGSVDHTIHILFGVAFILGATLTFKRFLKI